MSTSPRISVWTPLIHCSFLHLSHEIAAFGVPPFVGSGEVSCPQTSWETPLNLTCLHIWWPSCNVVLGESLSKTGLRNTLSQVVRGACALQKKASRNLLKSLPANGCRQIPKWDQMSTLVFLFCQLDSAPPLHRTFPGCKSSQIVPGCKPYQKACFTRNMFSSFRSGAPQPRNSWPIMSLPTTKLQVYTWFIFSLHVELRFDRSKRLGIQISQMLDAIAYLQMSELWSWQIINEIGEHQKKKTNQHLVSFWQFPAGTYPPLKRKGGSKEKLIWVQEFPSGLTRLSLTASAGHAPGESVQNWVGWGFCMWAGELAKCLTAQN